MTDRDVQAALAWMKRAATKKDRENLPRFGITAASALGVSMANLRAYAKKIGRDHDLAAALWDTDVYEARLLATLVDEPARVTSAQMDAWCKEFDNWAICDTACFALFDRTPHAWSKIARWAARSDEFQKRAAFALLAAVALHDKKAPDAPFLDSLALVERASTDGRNFVKKGVSWALRSIGHRSLPLHAAASALASRLAASDDAAARWIGKDAARDLGRALSKARAAKKTKTTR